MVLAIRSQEVVGSKLQVHAGLANGLPLQTLVQGEAPVLIGIEGAAQVPPPVQPGAELVIVRQVHLLIGSNAGFREIEHRLVEARKQVGLLVKDIPAAVPQSGIGLGPRGKTQLQGAQQAVLGIFGGKLRGSRHIGDRIRVDDVGPDE